MNYLIYMQKCLARIVELRAISETYPRWFNCVDAKTGRRFCVMSTALKAELLTYQWHLHRWLKRRHGHSNE